MLDAEGIIKVEHGQRMVVDLDEDFTKYYSYFIQQRYWVKPSLPLHGSHITLTNKKFHKDVDWDRGLDYHGQILKFQYDPYLMEGGFLKGFIMFYVKVYSDEIDQIKKDIGVIEPDNFRGSHVTIASIGKSGGGVKLYWPELITIKG